MNALVCTHEDLHLIRLLTLGRPTILMPDGTEAFQLLRQQKRLALLIYLTTFRWRDSHTWSDLAPLFWPGSDQHRVQNALRQALHYLRRSLGETAVIRHPDQSLSVDRGSLWVDAEQFRQALADEEWEVALDLYNGDFMRGISLPGLERLEAWIDEERVDLRQAAARCARRLGDQSESNGHLRAATARWQQAAMLWPANEATVQRLVSSLVELGDRVGAVRAFHIFERQLRLTVGDEPSLETRRLMERLIRSPSPRDPEFPAQSSEAGPNES